eukprot:TRINITY_DN14653_c0_g1_i1.p1 TRINITY_DN14653_c0_g1~~TRINITY_DN14653_c0_g1_i1.p1  ORF type:complete len:136 (-),score=7.39 TRINITY_DN14653_c0_g1_i1:78-485(-)
MTKESWDSESWMEFVRSREEQDRVLADLRARPNKRKGDDSETAEMAKRTHMDFYETVTDITDNLPGTHKRVAGEWDENTEPPAKFSSPDPSVQVPNITGLQIQDEYGEINALLGSLNLARAARRQAGNSAVVIRL